MSADLPISSKYRSTPAKPVDTEERERLGRQLNDAFTRGELDADDYQHRLDTLYGASTLGELVPVVSGLAPLATFEEPEIVKQTGRPGEVGQPTDGRRFRLVLFAVLAAAVVLLVILRVIFLAVL